MERTLIQWNIINWITILLMAAIGFAVSGVVVAFLKSNLPTVNDALSNARMDE
jgi:predicted lysophospholipase L1 biosynthesis ABC-type transport system permease subunit